jgi:hypothetical protein
VWNEVLYHLMVILMSAVGNLVFTKDLQHLLSAEGYPNKILDLLAGTFLI